MFPKTKRQQRLINLWLDSLKYSAEEKQRIKDLPHLSKKDREIKLLGYMCSFPNR